MRPLLSVARTEPFTRPIGGIKRDLSGGSQATAMGTRPLTRHNDAMPMREECKNFESRTYANGETVRKCNLDLAPDAPWRCPEPCVGYERRLADVNWAHGKLVTPVSPDEPPGLDDGSAAAVLDEAEDIVNAIGPGILADFQPRKKKGWKRFRRK
jgi:hypothetical protein